jgi:quercetin dioxygenase-like cupin family protein
VPQETAWQFHLAPLDVPSPCHGTAWTIGSAFDLPMPGGWRLHWHVSSLAAGAVPHPRHRHPDEELIVPLCAPLDIVREADVLLLQPGDAAFHPSECLHTLQAGERRATYVVLRWRKEHAEGAPADDGSMVTDAAAATPDPVAPGWLRTVLIDRPTRFLSRLRVHRTEMAAGCGYGWHEDDHDLAIVLVRGTVVSMTRRIAAPAILLHRAGSLHDIRCEGPEGACWFAVELHRAA